MLVVDDSDETREMYAWCLRAAGWFVEGVTNGAEAVFAAASFAPDVILMDLQMPVLDGLQAIRWLKRDESTKHVPIVAVSGYDQAAGEMRARAAGCDAFLAKPCDPDLLREVLERIVTGRAG